MLSLTHMFHGFNVGVFNLAIFIMAYETLHIRKNEGIVLIFIGKALGTFAAVLIGQFVMSTINVHNVCKLGIMGSLRGLLFLPHLDTATTHSDLREGQSTLPARHAEEDRHEPSTRSRQRYGVQSVVVRDALTESARCHSCFLSTSHNRYL